MTIRFLRLSISTILLMTWLVFGQEKADELVRVQTELVSVPVIVSDRNGRYIRGLGQQDFGVFQDGVEQKIEFFASTEEPINVALLIDTSQSTRFVLDDIKGSARSFIKLLTPNDKAMIVSFDHDTHVLSPLTSDRRQLEKAVGNAEIPDRRFDTTLRDAINSTITRDFANVTGRKAIIVLSDGKDAGSQIIESDLLFRLEESDTLVYTVMFKTEELMQSIRRRGNRRGGIFGSRFPNGRNGDGMPGRGGQGRRERIERQNEEAAEFLGELATMTGATHHSSKDGKLSQLFSSIVEELRLQYRIGYYVDEASKSGTLHRIKIKVDRKDVAVRHRSTYRSVEVSR